MLEDLGDTLEESGRAGVLGELGEAFAEAARVVVVVRALGETWEVVLEGLLEELSHSLLPVSLL